MAKLRIISTFLTLVTIVCIPNAYHQDSKAGFHAHRTFHRFGHHRPARGRGACGQDLIRAARVSATLSQIEKYQTAVNTFRGKYGYLPGDIKDPEATSFGFASRGSLAGEGDGNGLILGWQPFSPGANAHAQCAGETAMFWADLSAARLIEGSFSSASSTTAPSYNITFSSSPPLSAFLPPAKIGNSNSVYVYSGGLTSNDSQNYFGLSAVTQITTNGNDVSTSALNVWQASKIDSKMDDGLPQSGNVQAFYVSVGGVFWAGTTTTSFSAYTTATSESSTSCFDNGNVSGLPQLYSVGANGGANVNCALSFRFQ